MPNSRPQPREPKREPTTAVNRWGAGDAHGLKGNFTPFRPAGPDKGPALRTVSSHDAPVTESEQGVMTEPLN